MQALKVGYIFPDFSKEVRETTGENHWHAPMVDWEKAKALVALYSNAGEDELIWYFFW